MTEKEKKTFIDIAFPKLIIAIIVYFIMKLLGFAWWIALIVAIIVFYLGTIGHMVKKIQ